LERNLRLTDGILRYLTVRDDEATEATVQSTATSGSEQAEKVPEEAAKTESPV
jgi:hypothetical protein